MKKNMLIIVLLLSTFLVGCSSKELSTIKRPVSDIVIANDLEIGLWGLNAINYSDEVYDELFGESKLNKVTVAIIDTGVDIHHPDISEYIIGGYDFVNDDDDPNDDNGHGTQLAGIIGGKYTGVAHGVNIMPIKVLDERGVGKSNHLAEGILWAVDNGADIINLSLGRRKHESLGKSLSGEDSFNSLEYDAILYALINNVPVITVAGDFGVEELAYPAAYVFSEIDQDLIVVSAYDMNNQKSTMANVSEEIDLVAPGELILTITPHQLDIGEDEYTNIDGDGYIFGKGTSYASAFITGAVSIIKAYEEDIDTDAIQELLRKSTFEIGDNHQTQVFGKGSIDIMKLIRNMQEGI